jgi:hypothetical protein
VKWEAGVRPRSIATISAIRSSSGVRATISVPESVGTLPPATGSTVLLIVPPVNTIATRARGAIRAADQARTRGGWTWPTWVIFS